MSPYRRNILVGVVVLGAVSTMVWMAMEFGGRTAALFAPPRFAIHFDSDRADGLAEGSTISFHGVQVGQVSAIHLKPDMSGVIIDAVIDKNQHVPENVRAQIELTGLLGGGTSIHLIPLDHASTTPMTAGATIHAEYYGFDMAVIQDQFIQVGQMSSEVAKAVRAFRESGAITDLDTTIKQINTQAQHVGKVLDSVNSMVSDPQIREDIRNAIASIRQTSQTTAEVAKKLSALTDSLKQNSTDVSMVLNKTQGHIDEITKQLDARFEQVAKILDNMQSITSKVDNGKGTAAQLLNDGKLYQSLVESSNQLNETLATLHRLVDQWEQEGLTLKLNK